MRIIAIRPAPPGGKVIAHVDLEPSPGVRLYGVRVSRADDGGFRVFGPSNDRGRTCAFDPDVADSIARATITQMTVSEPSQHDRNTR